mgnify:CR=1 FL=1
MVIVQLTEKSGHKESGIIYGSNEAIVNNANYLNTIREEDKQIVKMNIKFMYQKKWKIICISMVLVKRQVI